MQSYDKAFLTGADHKTEWMLPWFFDNYYKYNDTPIVFANFGVKDIEAIRPYVHAIIDLTKTEEQGWFKKPKAMLNCPAKRVVWLDSDIQILKNIEDIFDRLQPNKLAMVEDKPWVKRRGGHWYNSGVVGFIGKPFVLSEWAKAVQLNPVQGDQEVLHMMLNDALKVLTYIEPLPNIYNWLRVQLENDRDDDPRKKMMHWTGAKGKERIKEMMSA